MEIKDEKGKSKKTTSKIVARTVTAHGPMIPTIEAEELIPSSIQGMNELLHGGYPPGAIINVTGEPKCGKSTFAIQESLGQAMLGHNVYFMYNESIQSRFMHIVNRHRNDLRIPDKVYMNLPITFQDRHGMTTDSANYKRIEGFVRQHILAPIGAYIHKSKPTLIVIDSLTKFLRRYPAQAFVFAEAMLFGIQEIFQRNKVKPIVLCINQKPSDGRKRDDDSVLGGMGIIHDMDGSIVFRSEVFNKWRADETGLSQGTKQRFIRIQGVRDVDVDEDEHWFIKPKGRLKIGAPLAEMVTWGKKEQEDEE